MHVCMFVTHLYKLSITFFCNIFIQIHTYMCVYTILPLSLSLSLSLFVCVYLYEHFQFHVYKYIIRTHIIFFWPGTRGNQTCLAYIWGICLFSFFSLKKVLENSQKPVGRINRQTLNEKILEKFQNSKFNLALSTNSWCWEKHLATL